MGLLGKLFGRGKGTKKYESIYLQSRNMNQSVEYAFKQAVDNAVGDGVFDSKSEAADALYTVIEPQANPEDKADLEKAKKRAAM